MATKQYKKGEMAYAVMQAKDDLLRAWQHLNNYVEGANGKNKMNHNQNKKLKEISNNILVNLGNIEAFAEDEIYLKEAQEEKAYRQYLKDIDAEIEALK
jgi:hypothetical protein